MADRILIRDLRLWCILGDDAEERGRRREVVLDLVLHADLATAGASDRLRDAVDYREVVRAVQEAVEVSSFRLVEALAERVAAVCLGNPAVERVVVTVDKPGAIASARSVAVMVERTRGEVSR